MKIHLIGICGTAMAALAAMLQDLGHQVIGSDSGIYPPMSDFLAARGIDILPGYQAGNIKRAAPDLVVIGNVARPDNPEAVRTMDLGLDYVSLPQALGRFVFNQRQSVVAAGTHGKTTTTALLAWLLQAAGAEPSFMVGGIARNWGANYHLGSGEHFVIEGDEYDTAFFDKEAKFLHYRPRHVVLTGVEFDHADIFADLEAIKAMFGKFIALIPPQGRLLVCADEPTALELARAAACPVIAYGLGPGAEVTARRIELGPGRVAFDLIVRGADLGRFRSPLPGRHNLWNTLGALGLLIEMGFDPADLSDGLARFKSVKRRQEVIARIPAGTSDIVIIDDFAHHPTAVRETLAGLDEFYSDRPLVAVFEPRTNTSRRKVFQTDYPTAFGAAQSVYIRQAPPKADIPPEEMFSSARLVDDLRAQGQTAAYFPETDSLLAALTEAAEPGQVIVIMSNGGFDGLHQRLTDALTLRFGSTGRGD